MSHPVPRRPYLSDTEAEAAPPMPIDEVARRIWVQRKGIAAAVLLTGLVTAAITLAIPNKYTASSTLLPEPQSGLGAAGIGQLAASIGLSVGRSGNTLTDLYPTIITSDRVLSPLLYREFSTRAAEPVRLIDFLKVKGDSAKRHERGLVQLRENALGVGTDRRTAVTSLSVTLRDPVVAAGVANAIVASLDSFARFYQRRLAENRGDWIETRLGQVRAELAASEAALRDFRVRNRVVASSPDLLLVEQRLQREVETNSAVYTELRRQLEVSKIDEVKNIPVVQTLDTARVPVRKSTPRRTVIVLGATLLATIFLTVIAIRLPPEMSLIDAARHPLRSLGIATD